MHAMKAAHVRYGEQQLRNSRTRRVLEAAFSPEFAESYMRDLMFDTAPKPAKAEPAKAESATAEPAKAEPAEEAPSQREGPTDNAPHGSGGVLSEGEVEAATGSLRTEAEQQEVPPSAQ